MLSESRSALAFGTEQLFAETDVDPAIEIGTQRIAVPIEVRRAEGKTRAEDNVQMDFVSGPSRHFVLEEQGEVHPLIGGAGDKARFHEVAVNRCLIESEARLNDVARGIVPYEIAIVHQIFLYCHHAR